MGVSTQSTWETGGRMQVLLAVRSLVGLLATLAIAKAAKLNDDALYHVVEDLPGNETQESGGENVATCSDVMARNGLNLSSFWHGAAHGLHSLHLEEIRHFLSQMQLRTTRFLLSTKISLLSRQSCSMHHLRATMNTSTLWQSR